MSEEVKESTIESPTQEAVSLTIHDLTSIKSIIDLAAHRGAFKPNEMVGIGTIYTKLASFLEEAAKQTSTQ